MEFLDFVTIDVWTMIFTWGNLLILFLLVKRLLFKPVNRILEQRTKQIEEDSTKAAKARAEAEAMQAEYEEKLAQARETAGEIVQSANYKASLRGEEILNEAQKKASEMLKKADEQIAKDRKKAMNEMKNDISGLAILAAKQVLGREINPADHEKLIEEFIENAGDTSWQNQ